MITTRKGWLVACRRCEGLGQIEEREAKLTMSHRRSRRPEQAAHTTQQEQEQ